MSFAFVPRKVGNRKATSASFPSEGSSKANDRSLVPSQSHPTAAPLLLSSADESLQAFADDLAILVLLSLTEYALWADGDMRRRIEERTEGEEQFLPLRYVLKHSPLRDEFQKLKTKLPSEGAIVKALRKNAEEEVEVRMVLSGPKWSNWASTSSSQTDEGMYEVRRKKRTPSEAQETFTRDYWAKRTIYMENIPPGYRTTLGIYRFIQSIYNSPTNPVLQRISFPPHHLDADSSLHSRKPKCKGFAFVVLSSIEEVTHLSRTWNWDRHPSEKPSTPIVIDDPSTAAQPKSASISEAHKYGFRAIPKVQWDILRDEYVAWRQKLLNEVFSEQEQYQEMEAQADEEFRDDDTEFNEEVNEAQEQFTAPNALAPVASSDQPPPSTSTNSLSLSPSSSYPPNCLLFVRNVHSGTNKTTLRALFTKALLLTWGGSEAVNSIDYIDYTKGTDTCYLRLATPSDARDLQAYFEKHQLVQTGPLDDDGTSSTSSRGLGSILVELVQGTREKIYWEKVPLKVRQDAVRKAISIALENPGASATPESKGSHTQAKISTPSKPQKRSLSVISDTVPLETERIGGDKCRVVSHAEVAKDATESLEDAEKGKRRRKRKKKVMDSF